MVNRAVDTALPGRLLLDTHVVLWWLIGDPTLPDEVKQHLDHDPDVFVSTATIWEVTVKQSLGKLDGPPDLPERIRDCGFLRLDIDCDHAMTAGRLPPIHRDPFDRMLVAQSHCEGLTLVTRDPHCRRYDIATLAI